MYFLVPLITMQQSNFEEMKGSEISLSPHATCSRSVLWRVWLCILHANIITNEMHITYDFHR